MEKNFSNPMENSRTFNRRIFYTNQVSIGKNLKKLLNYKKIRGTLIDLLESEREHLTAELLTSLIKKSQNFEGKKKNYFSNKI